MIALNRVRNWIAIAVVGFLGIIGIVGGAKWVAAKGVPLLSPVAAGAVSAWRVAA